MAKQNFCVQCGKQVGPRAQRCGTCRNLSNPNQREYARRGAIARAARQAMHKQIAESVIRFQEDLRQVVASLPDQELDRLAVTVEATSGDLAAKRLALRLRSVAERTRTMLRVLDHIQAQDNRPTRLAA